MEKIRIGDVLVEGGYITKEQLDEALELQRNSKGPRKRVGVILVELGYITELEANEALAKRMGIDVVDLSSISIDKKALSKIPEKLAKNYEMVGYKEDENFYYIAVADPLNLYAIEDVRQITQARLHIAIDTIENISNAIKNNYSEIIAQHELNKAAISRVETAIETIEDVNDETPIVKALNRLLILGHNMDASDIHIEPCETELIVRMRVDGVIKEVAKLDKNIHLPLITRIKIMSDMDIAERRLPQDGHFTTNLEEAKINARVSVVPTVMGEKAVIRFIREDVRIDRANHFGMDDENYTKFKKILTAPYGMVFITGPTGSGKTTTLYMVLEEMAQKDINIETIEDPVEKNIKGISQIQVNKQSGLSFESGLRSLLRQDPDVIMVGETRDGETAEIGVRAAITGHVVFSTLHTNNALSAIVRLKDMGVPAYLIANALSGLVAQRLARKVCKDCCQIIDASEKELSILGVGSAKIRVAGGCPKCNGTGYKGRIAIHEVVAMNKDIRRMIVGEEPIEEIEKYLRERDNFVSIQEEARRMVLEGIITMEEYQKVAYYVD